MFDSEQVSYLLGVESTNLRLQHELNFWDKKVKQIFIFQMILFAFTLFFFSFSNQSINFIVQKVIARLQFVI